MPAPRKKFEGELHRGPDAEREQDRADAEGAAEERADDEDHDLDRDSRSTHALCAATSESQDERVAGASAQASDATQADGDAQDGDARENLKRREHRRP